MENAVTITSGENLKRIRKELGLRQQEIVGDEITRNLVSMIENNKTPLSYRIAKVISENINKISIARDIGIHLDPEDILEPKRKEAKEKADKYITELKKHIENDNYTIDEFYFKEVEEFLNKWNIPDKKVIIYELLGDMYYYNKNYEKEYIYLNRALENYYINPIKEDIYDMIIKLMVNRITTEHNEEAIKLSELNIMERIEIPLRYRKYIHYNKALAYKRLKKVHKSLKLIEEFEELYGENTGNLYRKTLILKGSCFSKIQKPDKAYETYKKFLRVCGVDNEEAGLIYSNIIIIFRKQNNKEKVIEYKDKLLEYISKAGDDNIYLVKIYYRLGELFEYLDDIGKAEYYYVSAVNKATDRKENDKLAKLMFKLLNLYLANNQVEKIFLNDYIIKKIIKGTKLSDEIKLALKLTLANLKTSRYKEAITIINGLLEEDNNNET